MATARNPYLIAVAVLTRQRYAPPPSVEVAPENRSDDAQQPLIEVHSRKRLAVIAHLGSLDQPTLAVALARSNLIERANIRPAVTSAIFAAWTSTTRTNPNVSTRM